MGLANASGIPKSDAARTNEAHDQSWTIPGRIMGNQKFGSKSRLVGSDPLGAPSGLLPAGRLSNQWRVVIDATLGRERSRRNIEPTGRRWDESREHPPKVGGVPIRIVLLCSTLGVTGASKSPSLGGAGRGPNHLH